MVIALVMRAVRGGGAGGLGSSGAGQDGTRSSMLTLQMFPGISLSEEAIQRSNLTGVSLGAPGCTSLRLCEFLFICIRLYATLLSSREMYL